MNAPSLEINCPGCGKDSLLLRKPVYDGFKKVGESLSCAACGHPFADEASVPFKARETVQVFTEADKPRAVRAFDEAEAQRLCRHCANYVVNPFVQWCGLHRREVEATDTCAQFAVRAPPAKPKL